MASIWLFINTKVLLISALRPLCPLSTQVSYRHELLFTCQLAALTPLMCTQAYRRSLPSTNQVQNVEFWYHYIICFPATMQDFVLVSSSMVALVMIHVLSSYYAGFWTSIAGCGRSHYIYMCVFQVLCRIVHEHCRVRSLSLCIHGLSTYHKALRRWSHCSRVLIIVICWHHSSAVHCPLQCIKGVNFGNIFFVLLHCFSER